MAPAVPYVVWSARPNAARPAPRAVTSVPSTSNRKSRTSGGEAAQALDHAGQRLEDRVDLGGRRPTTEREAERALELVARAPDGAQHVRGLAARHVARGAGRRSHPPQVELEQHTVGLHAADDDARVMRQARPTAGTCDARPRYALEHAFEQAITHAGQPCHLGGTLSAREIGRHPHADD